MSSFVPFIILHINDRPLGTPRSYRLRPVIKRRVSKWRLCPAPISGRSSTDMAMVATRTHGTATTPYSSVTGVDDA